jgi:hypothetical protein
MTIYLKELTKDQIDALPRYAKQGCEIGLKATTEPMDVDKVHELICNHLTLILGDEASLPPRENVLVYDSPYEAVKKHKHDGISQSNAFYGNQDINWLQYYNYYRCETILGERLPQLEKIKYLLELTKHVGWFWVSSSHIILTRLPVEAHTITLQTQVTINQEDTTIPLPYLHKEEGPAMVWADGSALYSFRGNTIGTHLDTKNNWMITTPADELDVKQALATDNVDHRAILLERLPKEKLAGEMAVIHEKAFPVGGQYYLREIQIGDTMCRYLDMTCPSGKDKRIEGVPLSINTVDQALWWRLYEDELASSDEPFVEAAAQS